MARAGGWAGLLLVAGAAALAAGQAMPPKLMLTSCGARGAVGPSLQMCLSAYGRPAWLLGVSGGTQNIQVWLAGWRGERARSLLRSGYDIVASHGSTACSGTVVARWAHGWGDAVLGRWAGWMPGCVVW